MFEKMYQMTLGERLRNTPGNYSIEELIRVPNGWIYIRSWTECTTSVFIPYSSEFETNVE